MQLFFLRFIFANFAAGFILAKSKESVMNTNQADISKSALFKRGIRNGIPIGLGYLAVSFSLGIAACNVGLNGTQSFFASITCLASAGEFAGFTLIGAGASYLEIAIMTLVVNARYMLMSCSMSQRMSPNTGILHRFAMAYSITDELFAIAIARPGYLRPEYSYGATLASAPLWAIGTVLGCVIGNVMPANLVSAFSVALFGMFLAVIIPQARNNRTIAYLIAFCFILSAAGHYLPALNAISSGTKTIVLTIVISALAALIYPVKQEENNAE